MTENAALIQKARRYLKSAELLLKDKDYESSVSRAYYSMFYAAEAALLTKGLSFSSHKGVISGFGEHFVKTGIFPKEMARELNLAFEKRQLGDYEYTSLISQEDAEEVLQKAKDFVDAIARWLETPPR
jgi:uncharacterized protein (UPF0332 family)